MSNQESREAAGRMGSDPVPQLPSRGVVFENRVPTRRSKRITAKQKLLVMVDNHLELEPEKPFDYGLARRRIGVSYTTMSKVIKRLEASKYPFPQSTREHARENSRRRVQGRANPNLKRDAVSTVRKKLEAVIRESRRQRKSLVEVEMDAIQVPGQELVSDTTARHIMEKIVTRGEVGKLISEARSREELREYDMKVRNLYNLRYSYAEIAEWLREENLSNINNALTRLEADDEIKRRKKIKKKSDATTSSS